MPENVPGITCRQSRKMIHNCSIGYTGGKRIMHKPKKQQPIVNYPLTKVLQSVSLQRIRVTGKLLSVWSVLLPDTDNIHIQRRILS
mgnify:CR=1 FL=1